MLFLTLENLAGMPEVVFFPDAYRRSSGAQVAPQRFPILRPSAAILPRVFVLVDGRFFNVIFQAVWSSGWLFVINLVGFSIDKNNRVLPENDRLKHTI